MKPKPLFKKDKIWFCAGWREKLCYKCEYKNKCNISGKNELIISKEKVIFT